jgi:hypothetical protein
MLRGIEQLNDVGEVLRMQDSNEGTSLTVACSLTGGEFQERRAGLLRKFSNAVLEVRELADGYAYRFPADNIWITELANLPILEI